MNSSTSHYMKLVQISNANNAQMRSAKLRNTAIRANVMYNGGAGDITLIEKNICVICEVKSCTCLKTSAMERRKGLFYAKLLKTSTFNETNLEASFGSITCQRGSARQCCKGHLSFLWEKPIFDPSQKPSPLTYNHKNLHY
jgi:hypothetical protein